MDFETRLTQIADKVTVVLDQLIPPADGHEAVLMHAMRYAALSTGKRLRPFLVMECGAIFDVPEKSTLRVAAALECIHTYSLIHDDLPCMDNDDLRRGQPTLHRKFDEATALLAGDALQALAFEVLADKETHLDALVRCKLIHGLATAIGSRGMVGGQMIDMLSSDFLEDLSAITRMHRMKTGYLFNYAVETACIMGGASEGERNALIGFTNDIGLVYQISDDLLDVEGDAKTTGKAVNKDSASGKINFVSSLGVEGAKQRIAILSQQARNHIAGFHSRAQILLEFIDFIVSRKH